MKLTNWGNYPIIDSHLRDFRTESELLTILENTKTLIPRGLGRCYGDAALSETVVSTLRFNRILNFDKDNGELVCESGVSLEEILEVFVPRGWFLPVSPGTKFVTVGGAIASDIHGKNHHASGSISQYIQWMDLMLSDGERIRCSKQNNSDLFWGTCGGMGLTGIILRACLNLIPVFGAYIRQETVRAEDLEGIMELFEESSGWTYSVAWVDCQASGKRLGRSVMIRGEHADREEIIRAKVAEDPLVLPRKRNWNVPVFFPNLTLNRFTIKAFNALYHSRSSTEVKSSFVDLDAFFYPLDRIRNWNRIYGRRGFTQYQFVLPKESSLRGLQKILSLISANGHGSFLAVLKLFGKQEGLISFPMEGYTLSLDFPISGPLLRMLDALDRILLDHGGRIYLTKDVRMERNTFDKGYPNAGRFRELKNRFDKRNKLESLQSRRIGIGT
jgi:FAD/FMN-containing dehydrogenase